MAINSRLFFISNNRRKGFFQCPDLVVKVKDDSKGTLTLALDSLIKDHGVLIFCESKNTTEVLARKISATISQLMAYSGDGEKFQKPRDSLLTNMKKAHLIEIIEQLKKCPSKLDVILEQTITSSVAFHHAGLSMDERDIIESGFKSGSIKVLFATPTLSSGVNLPARRVIIHSAKVGIDNMSALVYRQMCGRAGRKGIDEQGESIIIVRPDRKDEQQIKNLIFEPLQPIKSRAIELNNGKPVINERYKRFLLEPIATGMVTTFDEIENYMACSFFAQQSRKLTKEELSDLLDELIKKPESGEQSIQRLVDNDVEKYVPSKLGIGILASSFPPDEAIRLRRELSQAMNGLSLNCDLHLLYYVIPNSNLDTKRIDWSKFNDILLTIIDDRNKAPAKHVMDLLNIDVGFVQKMNNDKPYSDKKGKHIKFYYAFALNDIMREKTLAEVSKKYDINRGELQALQQRSSSYCGMLSIFVKKLGWETLAVIIKMFQDRLYFGISQDLIELMNISCLNAQMARCLHDAGLIDVKTIAHSKEFEIYKILINKAPENLELKSNWVSTKCKSMTDSEISELIIKEARCVIEEQAGGKLKWDFDESLGVETADTTQLSRRTSFSDDGTYDNTKVRVKYVNDKLSQIEGGSQTTLYNVNPNEPNSNQSSPRSSPLKRSHSPYKYGYHSYRSPKRSMKYNLSERPFKKRKNFNNKSFDPKTSDITEESDRSVIFSSPQGDKATSAQEMHMNNLNVTDKFEVVFEDEHLNSGILTDIGSAQLSSCTDDESEKSEKSEKSTKSISDFKVLSQSPDVSKRNMDVELFDPTDDENLTAGDEETEFLTSSSSVGNVQSTTNKLNSKLFYDSPYNQGVDERCFQKVDYQAVEICNLINEDKLRFFQKTIMKDKMASLIKKLESTELFTCHVKLTSTIIKEKDFLTNAERTCQDTRVTPEWLDKIERMCFLFGNQTIYCLNSNQMVRLFRDQLINTKFEFKQKLVTAICYDAKLIYKILKACIGFSETNLKKIYWHDPKIADWLLDPDSKEVDSFMEIAHKYVDIKNKNTFFRRIQHNIEQSEKEEKNEAKQDIQMLATGLLMYPVMSTLKHLLKEKLLYVSYINVESPVLIMFAQMELKGFTLDQKELKRCRLKWTELNNELDELIHNDLVKRGIKTIHEKRLNVRAPREVRRIFTKLKLYDKLVERPEFKITKEAAKLKTGKDVLEKLRTFEPLAGWISDSRKMYHLLDARNNLIEEMERLKIDNLVIGTYKMHLATGRIAMFNPNLLGIDGDTVLKIENKTSRLSLRKVFKAKDKYTLITADYCQLELRILAALSKEENLTALFQLGKDPFQLIAARIKRKDVDKITPLERQQSKQIMYAIIYGQGLKRLTDSLGVDDEEIAKEFLKEFHDAFPSLNKFIETSKQLAQENGYIETLFGRRRYLQHINSNDKKRKAGDERKAVNSRIQGSASDLVKLTMLKLDYALQRSKVDAEFLLQIHDELIFQVRDEEENVNEFARILINQMEDCGRVLKTRLSIKLRKGLNWSEMNELNINDYK